MSTGPSRPNPDADPSRSGELPPTHAALARLLGRLMAERWLADWDGHHAARPAGDAPASSMGVASPDDARP
jgi:hypothetical protein